jgi:glutathione S-transferase
MDWQAIDLFNALRNAFIGLVVNAPVPGGDEAIQASLKAWPAQMEKVESQLRKTGAYITGTDFNLADVSMGLAVNRWFATELPIERPEFPATSAYYDLLSQRPAFLTHGRNGTP